MLFLSITIVIYPFVITDVTLDLGPLFTILFAQETLKQLERQGNDAREFGIALCELVLVHLVGVILDLDLGLTACGLPCILGNQVVAIFCTLAYALASAGISVHFVRGLVTLLFVWLRAQVQI